MALCGPAEPEPRDWHRPRPEPQTRSPRSVTEPGPGEAQCPARPTVTVRVRSQSRVADSDDDSDATDAEPECRDHTTVTHGPMIRRGRGRRLGASHPDSERLGSSETEITRAWMASLSESAPGRAGPAAVTGSLPVPPPVRRGTQLASWPPARQALARHAGGHGLQAEYGQFKSAGRSDRSDGQPAQRPPAAAGDSDRASPAATLLSPTAVPR